MIKDLEKLKNIIDKSRIHFYKPIQIAEILHRYRVGNLNSLKKHEEIRKDSKKWRDLITLRFINSKCSSSAKFQDDLFSKTAVPFDVLERLGDFNNTNNGILEAYVYERFLQKHSQLKNALQVSKDKNFNVKEFVNSFTEESGLKRSTDKIYEIIIFALFETLVTFFEVQQKVYVVNHQSELLEEFAEFVNLVLGLNAENDFQIVGSAHFFRAGITNAADRGIDLYANSGHVVQVKHVDLDSNVLSGIGNSVSSNKIIIICKSYQKDTIVKLLSQIGFGDRIHSIITFNQIYEWYESAFNGNYSKELSTKILNTIQEQIILEFPIIENNDFDSFFIERGYDQLDTAELKFK